MSETATCAKCAYTMRFPYTTGEMVKIFFDNHDCDSTKLQQAIKRVRELHKPYKFDVLVDLQACSECSQINRHGISVFSVLHPCPTIKALDGDK